MAQIPLPRGSYAALRRSNQSAPRYQVTSTIREARLLRINLGPHSRPDTWRDRALADRRASSRCGRSSTWYCRHRSYPGSPMPRLPLSRSVLALSWAASTHTACCSARARRLPHHNPVASRNKRRRSTCCRRTAAVGIGAGYKRRSSPRWVFPTRTRPSQRWTSDALELSRYTQLRSFTAVLRLLRIDSSRGRATSLPIHRLRSRQGLAATRRNPAGRYGFITTPRAGGGSTPGARIHTIERPVSLGPLEHGDAVRSSRERPRAYRYLGSIVCALALDWTASRHAVPPSDWCGVEAAIADSPRARRERLAAPPQRWGLRAAGTTRRFLHRRGAQIREERCRDTPTPHLYLAQFFFFQLERKYCARTNRRTT